MEQSAEGSITSLTTSGERAFAGGTWLLPSAPSVQQAVAEWRNAGAAWLRPGVLFGAVVIREDLVHAALALDDPELCAAPLAEGLENGPVFYSREGFGNQGSYTALVPASVALTWRVGGSMGHHYRALLLVPAPDVVKPPDDGGPWWVVPMDGPGLLCPPDRLAALVRMGRAAVQPAEGEAGDADA
ncbi:hypothetical protein [Streptomyces sp. NBC_01233]|uniref:hypothetical protein n=1 Tax=Streptomyces sp. NBC_01233 TaxID=2903787 RepID=UPI002E10735B|nr:hypothetical protein OG332_23795 [Streptomyces sp. NBC_01233]